jgi:hypothetical protein
LVVGGCLPEALLEAAGKVGQALKADRPIRIRLYDANGELIAERRPVLMLDRSWQQLNNVVPHTLSVGYASVEVTTYGCSLWAYASVIERATGDPAMVPLAPETTIYPATAGRSAVPGQGWFR